MKAAETQFLEAISSPIYHVRKENMYPNKYRISPPYLLATWLKGPHTQMF